MSPLEAERRLFGDALVCSEDLPYSLMPWSGGEAERAAHAAAAERLLRSLAGLDAGVQDELEPHPAEQALQRLDAKLDLVLELLSRMLAREHPETQPRPLRWSRHGACAQSRQPLEEGSHALLVLVMPAALSLPLRLPVQVLAREDQDADARLWLAFPQDAPALTAALERFLFRQHRRQVAASRRERG
jgi:hypothetical protein